MITNQNITTGAYLRIHGSIVMILLAEDGLAVLSRDIEQRVRVPYSWILRLKKDAEVITFSSLRDDAPISEEDALEAAFNEVDVSAHEAEDDPLGAWIESAEQRECRTLPVARYADWMEFVRSCQQAEL